jgi:microcystin-dependent protein
MKTITKIKLTIVLLTIFAISSISNAQVIVSDNNATTGNSSAVLDVISGSGDKGLLIPRVSIPSLLASAPVSSPATGLLVYNTNSTTGPGFFYWNGSAWTALSGSIASESDPVYTAWDKDYADLTNKPTIPTVPTNLSAFTNDASYLTSYTETDPIYTAWDKDYADLTNKPTIPTVPTNVSVFTNDASYLTSYTETDPIYTSWDKDYADLTNKPTILNSQWTTTGSNIYYNTGNVGIGTTTPTDLFQVGNLKIGGDNGREIYSTNGYDINYKATGLSSHHFYANGIEKFIINSSGNVGIGTVTPAYKLDVNGAINGTSVLVNGVPVASSTDTYWSTAGAGKIQYSGGNVGVGIASPSYALDISGDVNVTGNFRINGAPLTGTGTVTSIDASGGTTGLTFSGGPVTTSGALTMGGTLAIANGGTNSTTASGARTNLGATTVGSNIFTLANPSSIGFLRVNADNSVSALTAADFRTAIGAGTGAGSVTSIASGNGMSFTTITGTGSVTLGTPSTLTNATTNTVTATSHTHAVTTVLPSSASSGIMTASGTKTAGGFYGGITAPSNTTRLNYDGYLYATQIYEGANRVYSAGNTNIGTGATNYSAGNHSHTGMGTVTSVSGTSPISVSNGTTTPVISLNTVPVLNGGTGTATAPTQGGVIYASSTSAFSSTAAGTSGQVLTSNGTSAPTWTTIASTPTGAIQQFAGSSAPSGYLLCEGQAVSRTTYSALFAVIGTTYGTGDGSTTFNVPNLKGKIPVGLNSSDVSFDARGETGGEKTHTITTAELPSHNHSFTGTAHSHTVDPTSVSSSTTGAHTHTVTDAYNSSELSDDANDRSVGSDATTSTTRTTSSSGDHSHTIDIPSTTSSSTTATGTIGITGSGSAINVLQPYIVLYYIIKY